MDEVEREELRLNIKDAADELAYQIDRLITDRLKWAANNPRPETYDDRGVEARKVLVTQAIIGVMRGASDLKRYVGDKE
jgi:hypothetical protein